MPDTALEKLRGKFIVFDGPDGCGKSTQRKLLADALAAAGLGVVQCRDPGGTTIGDRIRHVLLDYDLSQMDVRCETFLFMASRAQLVGEIVEPALAAGSAVLCDRFISSTCAYQGAAGYDIQRVIEVGRYAIGDTWPDLTLIFDVPVEQGFARTGRKPHHAIQRKSATGQRSMIDDAVVDAMEARPLEFHRRVREIYLALPKLYPRPVEVIDGRGPPEEVHAAAIEMLTRFNL